MTHNTAAETNEQGINLPVPDTSQNQIPPPDVGKQTNARLFR